MGGGGGFDLKGLARARHQQGGGCPFSALVKGDAPTTSSGNGKVVARRGSERRRPPGPPGGAFGREALRVVASLTLDGVPKTTLKLAQEYGDAIAFENPVGLGDAAGWTFLSSPDDIEHVSASNCNNYRERFLPDSYAFATDGKGILATGGEYNRRHRSLCQPSFQKKSLLASFADVVTESTEGLKRQWEESAASCSGVDGVAIDLPLHMQRLTLDIIGSVAFSHDFGQVAECGREMRGEKSERPSTLVQAVNHFGEALAEVFVTPMPILRVLEAIRYPSVTKLRSSLGTIHSEMRTIIEGRRAEYESGTNHTDDLLDSLMRARDENGDPLTTQELFEDVHDIMGAGHETTATTLSALIYSITRHKHVMMKIKEELGRVLGGRVPTFEDLNELEYTEMVVKEVLRLYPSIPIFPRVAAGDDYLPSGYYVPKGEVVFMSSYAMGRLDRLWEDPEVFDPERFAPEMEAKRHRYAFVPFGAGPRMCLGAKFAMLSLKLVTATLLQGDFDLEVCSPTDAVLDIDWDITMNFKKTNGIKVALR
ncbi:cytochrome P450 [Chloropicon primus]|uniref:Cytochrome P450 n=1 Tax=Chloropicon primus TaxID=1764295 RepID=A0A5B8MBN7_9CHLO|nr:cytochrome P450 [Chloropicon primus]|mmetsp:Transcript_12237/g.34002  ORF Transcript_12237/g.34002 Transcript_12237/m.34002 type:complete len:538 (-) Transcript_12237:2195-3808(-)|eukprot:QDZ17484.1 cytochrome P450 [Chloropicon primus]